MKNHSRQIPTQATSSVNHASTCLHELVKKLQISLLPQATSKKSFIVNDVAASVALPAEENTLAYIIGNLLSNAIYRTSECCIRVETECIGGQHQIRIRNSGAFTYSSYIHSLVHFLMLPENLVAISVSKPRKTAGSLLFFPSPKMQHNNAFRPAGCQMLRRVLQQVIFLTVDYLSCKAYCLVN